MGIPQCTEKGQELHSGPAPYEIKHIGLATDVSLQRYEFFPFLRIMIIFGLPTCNLNPVSYENLNRQRTRPGNCRKALP